MSFEEDLKAVIQKSKAEREQYEKVGSDFDNRWSELREESGLVWRVFQSAKRSFDSEQIQAGVQLINGSIVLEVTCDDREHKLSFQADRKRRVILCYSSVDGENIPPEEFTLDALDEITIQAKVRRFAERAVRGKLQQ